MSPEASFEVDVSPEIEPGQTLLVGLSSLGMAGLTAADYLVRNEKSEEIGHVLPEELPAITPIQEGRPRHHTRIYNLVDVDFTVLVSELFVPVWAARSFTETLLEWTTAVDIEEIVVLHGVPFPHGPQDHRIFHVATEAFEQRRLADTRTVPLQGGYLDGIPGELVSHSIDGDAAPMGVLVTPAHPPGPDVDASLMFLDILEDLYGLKVDLKELEDLSDSIQQHYATLAERMQAIQDAESVTNRDLPEDRMFM